MKTKYIIAAISFSTLFLACRKERTCACSSETKTTTVTTVQSNGTSTTTEDTSNNKNEATYSKVKKSEMTGLIGCSSQETTSIRDYTTFVSVPTTTTFGGVTFTTTTSQTADVKETSVNNSSCELK